jgi:multiple sugar transport system substrate-binding protein
MNKWFKRISLVALSGVMLGACVACGGGNDDNDSTGETSLRLWTPITGADLTVFNRLITQFNQEHKGEIRIDHQSEVRDTHYNNIKNNVPSSGPEMAIIHSQLVQNYAANGYIVPLDDSFFAEETIDTNDYLPNVLNTLYMDDNLYGIPLDVHPIVMYYNKALVGDNPLPTNYSELMALAQKLTNSSKGVWGMPMSIMWPSEFVYSTSLFQNGGQEISKDNKPLFNTEEGAVAAEVLRDVIHLYKVSPNNLQADQDMNLFTTGKAAFHMQGSWSLSGLQDALGEDLGAMPLSGLLTNGTGESSQDIMARSHVFTVCKTRRALSAKKKAAITTFIKWMGEHSADWSVAGQIPAYNPARESDTFKNAEFLSDFGDPNNFRTAVGAVYYEAGFETVFEYVTTIMKDNLDAAGVRAQLKAAEAEAIRAVKTEQEG